MPAEPTVSMTFECPTWGGTGERTEYMAGGGAVTDSSGRALRCRTCGGHRIVRRDVGLSELRRLLDEHGSA
jgi:hypothetical protein